MQIPQSMKRLLGNLELSENQMGRSGDRVLEAGDELVLKMSSHPGSLLREHQRMTWLQGRLPVPVSLAFERMEGREYHLMTKVPGESLVSPRLLKQPEQVVDVLVQAMELLKAVDARECPFASRESTGQEFVHGDLCLPNILVDRQGRITGFIDLEACGRGDRWLDVAWALWSLQYNLGTSRWNQVLLRRLGLGFDEERYLRYTGEASGSPSGQGKVSL